MRLFLAGEHVELADFLSPRLLREKEGFLFRLYAPRALGVSVVLRTRVASRHDVWSVHDLRKNETGLWHGVVVGARPGDRYAYLLVDANGQERLRSDPLALATEAPGSAFGLLEPSPPPVVPAVSHGRPSLIYEVHLPSWTLECPAGVDDTLAEELIARARAIGATHIEFLPLTEHPHPDSWGYQVTHYFAPTARLGSPRALCRFLDRLHDAGLGLLLDWVGAHFAVDEFALANFDGLPLYEPRDPGMRHHPDWGTYEFAFGEGPVLSFLLSSALFWLERYGFDGLRVDAASSILYRDYSRAAGQWRANAWGGRESVEGAGFLRRLTAEVKKRRPRAVLVAEESSNWPGVTAGPERGGLGFDMCWDCGWIHATRHFFKGHEAARRREPGAWASRLTRPEAAKAVLPLSHDEVVHGKKTPLAWMPGDAERRWANLRLFFVDLLTHPGTPLLFMGQEDAPEREWDHRHPLPPPADDPPHRGLARLLHDLAALRREGWLETADDSPALWISQTPYDPLVPAFRRSVRQGTLAVLHNGSVRSIRPLGLRLAPGPWRLLLSSDATVYGGRGRGRIVEARPTEGIIRVDLPPLSSLLLGLPR